MDQLEEITVKINSRSIKAFYRGENKNGRIDSYGSMDGKKVFIHQLQRLDDFRTLCMIDGTKRAIVYAISTKDYRGYDIYSKKGKDKLTAEICGGFSKDYGSNFLNFGSKMANFSVQDIEGIEVFDDHMIVQFKDGCYKAKNLSNLFLNEQDFTHLKVKIPQEHLSTWREKKDLIKSHIDESNKSQAEADELLQKMRSKISMLAKKHNNFDAEWAKSFNTSTRNSI